LAKIIGLEDVKTQLRDMLKALRVRQRREEMGFKLTTENKNLHMCFMGNPGTGKTTIGRLVAKMLFHLNVCTKENYVEVSRENLVAGYVGQTAMRTKAKIQEAKGGVMFVDEAYRLSDKGGIDYGLEAIETLMTEMTKNDEGAVIMLFAGYEERMQGFFASNPGMDRRIHYRFYFIDYTAKQLAEMLMLKLKNAGYKTSVTVDQILTIIEDYTNPHQRSKLNGSLADLLLQEAESNLVKRIDIDDTVGEAIITLLFEDFQAAGKVMRRKRLEEAETQKRIKERRSQGNDENAPLSGSGKTVEMRAPLQFTM